MRSYTATIPALPTATQSTLPPGIRVSMETEFDGVINGSFIIPLP